VEAKQEIHLGASKVATKRRIPETRSEARRMLTANVDIEKRLRTYILLFSVFYVVFCIKAYVGCCLYVGGGSEACARRVGETSHIKRGLFGKPCHLPDRLHFQISSTILHHNLQIKFIFKKSKRRTYYTQKNRYLSARKFFAYTALVSCISALVRSPVRHKSMKNQALQSKFLLRRRFFIGLASVVFGTSIVSLRLPVASLLVFATSLRLYGSHLTLDGLLSWRGR
jgi:hypothetical protein